MSHYVKNVQNGVSFGLYFPVLCLDMEIHSVNLRISSKCENIRTRKNAIQERKIQESDISFPFYYIFNTVKNLFWRVLCSNFVTFSSSVLLEFVKKFVLWKELEIQPRAFFIKYVYFFTSCYKNVNQFINKVINVMFCFLTKLINKFWTEAKDEDTLWNISFRLFHGTQFNVYFITWNLISWNHIKYLKRKPSRLRKNEFRCSCAINKLRTGTL